MVPENPPLQKFEKDKPPELYRKVKFGCGRHAHSSSPAEEGANVSFVKVTSGHGFMVFWKLNKTNGFFIYLFIFCLSQEGDSDLGLNLCVSSSDG